MADTFTAATIVGHSGHRALAGLIHCLIGLLKGDPVLVETTSPAPTDRIEDAQPDGQELVRRAEAQRVEDELTAELEKEVADHIERMLALHVAEEFPPATRKMMAEHYAGMLAKRW